MRLSILTLLALLLAACARSEPPPSILISLVSDGLERNYSYTVPVTVGEFLRDANIELGELDRVDPPTYTQITDGMRVTVVRIQEETYCEENPIPFRQRTVPNEGLQPGEERLGQAGQNGVEEVCYRVYISDGVRRDPVVISRTTITAPQDEVLFVGPSGEIDSVPVEGTLAYISNRNAWIIRGNSTDKRPLTTSGDLDERVFALSPDGQQLLFTRQTVSSDPEAPTFNTLWLLPDTSADAEPVRLLPENILYADWVPGQPNTISYSTGEPRDTAPGWQALNDLWIMNIDPQTSEPLTAQNLVERSSFGLYSWWGTGFHWSRSGDHLAWVRADSIGLVDLETGEFTTLLDYPVYNTRQPWSWRASVSWSPDDSLLLTTVHGQPIGSEPPETSPAFHVAVTDIEGTFRAELFQNAGIWSVPQFSPQQTEGGFPEQYLAFLRCRDFPNCFSDSAEYDLMLADRDGSNSRRIFPQEGQPGITRREFTWSPDGQQIAFIYSGNLWVIDVESGVTSQLTLDGGASRPIWMQ